MTRVVNTVEGFVDEALAGFVAVHSDRVRRVDGGVVRVSGVEDDHVAVIVGGGSGHYPAFAGLVGPGFAAGAVCGNIFSSPSAGQAYRVATEVENGGGTLFLYGNYAGDVLHFGRAQAMLRRDGIDARTVLVTDDIASAPTGQIDQRRGVAGDLVVFKIASAAAARGWTLDEVERVARLSNSRTRTLGVAFAGCTLPGSAAPLFDVPVGMMSVGLGIHGEPGISEQPIPTADELADLFVSRILEDRPSGIDPNNTKVTVIVNGLGTVKYEELFVLYGAVAKRVEAAGLKIVRPECGELVTSLDMAGASVTICWLTDELEDLWSDPADAPAFRRGIVPETSAAPTTTTGKRLLAPPAVSMPENDPEALRTSMPALITVLELITSAVEAEKDELGRIDAIAGDGDHGVGMSRGLHAASTAAEQVSDAGGGVGRALIAAGDAWSERAGGTSGALWGSALVAAGEAVQSAQRVDAAVVVTAATTAVTAITELGGARPGDKTMVDAAIPFSKELRHRAASGLTLTDAWTHAAAAATSAAEQTASLTPRLGRARPLAEKSLGHPDAGAVSFALIVNTIGQHLTTKDKS